MRFFRNWEIVIRQSEKGYLFDSSHFRVIVLTSILPISW
jgi:hypothetical protein